LPQVGQIVSPGATAGLGAALTNAWAALPIGGVPPLPLPMATLVRGTAATVVLVGALAARGFGGS
jgi:hypothetical protein